MNVYLMFFFFQTRLSGCLDLFVDPARNLTTCLEGDLPREAYEKAVFTSITFALFKESHLKKEVKCSVWGFSIDSRKRSAEEAEALEGDTNGRFNGR